MIDRYKGISDSEFAELFSKMSVIEGWENLEQFEKLKEDTELCKYIAGTLVNTIGIKELCTISFITNILHLHNVQELCELAPTFGLIVPPKKAKKGKPTIVSYLMGKHYKPAIRKYAVGYAEYQLGRMERQLSKSTDTAEEKFYKMFQLDKDDSSKNTSNRKYVALVMGLILDNEEITNHALNIITEEDWVAFDWRFIETYNYVSHCMAGRTGKNYTELMKETHEIKKDNEKLNKQLTNLSVNAEQQLQEALSKIEQLEEQLEDAHEVIEIKNMQLSVFQRQFDMQEPLAFEGLHILVLGHPSRKIDYQQVVEKYGGEYRFLTANSQGNTLAQVEGAVKWADYIVFISSYSSHTVWEKVVLYGGEKVIPTAKSGIHSVEKLLLQSTRRKELEYESSTSAAL